MRRGGLRQPERGTFAALGSPGFIEHLLRLGVTTVELLPVHAFVQQPRAGRTAACATTGATTRSASSRPSRPTCRRAGSTRCASRPPAAQRRHRGDARRGLQPHLRGQRAGPHAVLRGLDNASYYRLRRTMRLNINDTGCGNTLEPVASPRAADGDGLAALLVHRLQHRRLPFRPGVHAGPRAAWLRQGFGLLRRAAARTRSWPARS